MFFRLLIVAIAYISMMTNGLTDDAEGLIEGPSVQVEDPGTQENGTFTGMTVNDDMILVLESDESFDIN